MAIGDGVSALATLGVTFGGFSPTAMDGVSASREYIERVKELEAQRKIADKRRRELEFARRSKPITEKIDSFTEIVYVVIDNSYARIEQCESSAISLTIPDELGGYPVFAIAPDAFARNEVVEEIICPDSIESIGSCAFRLCPKLKRVVLPSSVSEFSSSWLQHCHNLEELVLPGMLETITAEVLDNRGLKRLYIGKNVHDIQPGAFQNTQLEHVVVSEENPFITTDGTAIYAFDGQLLLSLVRPVSSYTVQDGCVKLGRKSMYGIESLKKVVLPNSVEALDAFTFSHSGLCEFIAPSSLKDIGEKAFFYCEQLESVTLNEGLRVIGDSAFERSALGALDIPASIEIIGNSITATTNVVHAGPGCTLKLDPAAERLFLDGMGGLYRREDDGNHLLQLMDRETDHYTVAAGTSVIDEYAIARHDLITQVIVPEGVVRICANAFRFSQNLTSVDLPDSVEFIGDDAFLDTALEDIRIPRNLTSLGRRALVTKGAHRGEEMPSLQKVEVAEGNEVFYMTNGMLCRRTPEGDRVVVFTNTESHVVFPPEIVGIDEYAFNNARGIEYLSLNKELKRISTCGLLTWCFIELIHIEVAEPVEGRTVFDFEFPDTPRSIHGISQGIGGATWVNVPGIMAQYDNCIANAHDYVSPRNPDSISIYEQVILIIKRLQDPILLTDFNRSVFERLLRNYIIEICVDVARHDDRTVIDYLLEQGYVNEDNLEDIIMAVGRLQDAAMTGYLLELKRLRFGRSALDFDL